MLKSLLDLHKIQCDQNGMFKGEIRILNQSKICEHSLEIVEFLVKVYFLLYRKLTFREGINIK